MCVVVVLLLLPCCCVRQRHAYMRHIVTTTNHLEQPNCVCILTIHRAQRHRRARIETEHQKRGDCNVSMRKQNEHTMKLQHFSEPMVSDGTSKRVATVLSQKLRRNKHFPFIQANRVRAYMSRQAAKRDEEECAVCGKMLLNVFRSLYPSATTGQAHAVHDRNSRQTSCNSDSNIIRNDVDGVDATIFPPAKSSTSNIRLFHV